MSPNCLKRVNFPQKKGLQRDKSCHKLHDKCTYLKWTHSNFQVFVPLRVEVQRETSSKRTTYTSTSPLAAHMSAYHHDQMPLLKQGAIRQDYCSGRRSPSYKCKLKFQDITIQNLRSHEEVHIVLNSKSKQEKCFMLQRGKILKRKRQNRRSKKKRKEKEQIQ